jgi:hypothetical protein
MRFQSQFKTQTGGSRFWLSPQCFWAAWLGLLLAVVVPPHGTGTTVCWLKATTGIPCPGCGLTRSMSCALRGMPVESLHYHPLGMVILLMLVTMASVSLCPTASKQKIRQFIDDRPRLFNSVYWAFVIVFVGFGVSRAVVSFGTAL